MIYACFKIAKQQSLPSGSTPTFFFLPCVRHLNSKDPHATCNQGEVGSGSSCQAYLLNLPPGPLFSDFLVS